jgi:ATP-binding cassette subfamily F protein uup
MGGMSLALRKVSLGFGGPLLLDDVSLIVENGERGCIVGRNGAGKSTILKIAAGLVKADRGELSRPQEGLLTFLPQEIPGSLEGSVRQIVAGGLKRNSLPEWEAERLVERTLSEMGLDGDVAFATLSAGTKRRVLLAKAVVPGPEILLLDEPTNHLDIDAIAWLENYLLKFKGGVLFVTHDRAFLQNVATKILDLDRGRLTTWDCDYKNYLVRKDEWLEAEAHNSAVFDKKLSEEEAWLRKGVKARRTRNEGRVRALLQMREARRLRREKAGSVKMEVEQSRRSGTKVIAADNVSYGYDGKTIIKDYSDVVERGDKIGIVGPNGVGKSTLVKLLLGKLKPDSGTVEQGTNLEIAYFDQTRETLVETETVQQAIANGQEYVEINGARRHVMTYLQDFLFPPDRARSPVSMLSGGERNRLMLARLFAKPFNFLVMDEPTNDLDLETLELLEAMLVDFAGTLIVVSHDRAFLDNVVTELYVLDGSGEVQEYFGGYQDFLDARHVIEKAKAAETQAKARAEKSASGRPAKPRKFLNRERWELEAIPGEIEKIEREAAELTARLSDPLTYQEHAAEISAFQQRLAELEAESNKKFARWEELEALRKELEPDKPKS